MNTNAIKSLVVGLALASQASYADDALTVDASGNVGIGTAVSSASVHVFRDDGSAQMYVQESSTTTSPRTLVNLQNNGRPEIVMGNTGTNGEWSFGAGTNFILKQGAVGTTSAAKTKYFTLFAGSGNLEITGSIITGGPTCGAGCDAVFSNNYELPTISEHAQKMYQLGYLPNVGPTIAYQPINLTEHLGNMLNELEHAHIYIAQLEKIIAQQQTEFTRFRQEAMQSNDAIVERLKNLESVAAKQNR